MAKVELNDGLKRIRGKIDGWVYRNLNGQVVAHAYREPAKDAPSTAQLSQRERFRAAQAYAADVLADPLRRRVYQKLAAERKCPVNALVAASYLTPPTIELIELAAYSGRPDERIQVLAFDQVEVTDISVCIRASDGAVIETGAAIKQHGVWMYRTTASVPPGMAANVEVTARNPAGAAAVRTAESRVNH
jgi:hypothetical protein